MEVIGQPWLNEYNWKQKHWNGIKTMINIFSNISIINTNNHTLIVCRHHHHDETSDLALPCMHSHHSRCRCTLLAWLCVLIACSFCVSSQSSLSAKDTSTEPTQCFKPGSFQSSCQSMNPYQACLTRAWHSVAQHFLKSTTTRRGNVTHTHTTSWPTIGCWSLTKFSPSTNCW